MADHKGTEHDDLGSNSSSSMSPERDRDAAEPTESKATIKPRGVKKNSDDLTGCLLWVGIIAVIATTSIYFDIDFDDVWQSFLILVLIIVIWLFVTYQISKNISDSQKKSRFFISSAAFFLSLGVIVTWLQLAGDIVPRNDQFNAKVFAPAVSRFLGELEEEKYPFVDFPNSSFKISGPILILDVDHKRTHPTNFDLPKALSAQSVESVETLVGISESWEVVGTYDAGLDGGNWKRPGSTPALQHIFTVIVFDKVNGIKAKITHKGSMPNYYILSNYITGDKYQIVSKNGRVIGVANAEPYRFSWLVSLLEKMSNYSATFPLPFSWAETT